MLSRLFPTYRSYRLFFRRLVKLSNGWTGEQARRSYATTVQFGCGSGRGKSSYSWSSSSSNHHHRLKMGALWSATTASGLLLYNALTSSSDEHHHHLAHRSPMLKKAGMLAWEENRITDEELEELLKEFILIETIKEKAALSSSSASPPSTSASSLTSSTSTPAEEDNESYCKPEQIESSTSSASSSSENASFMAVSCLRARASSSSSDQDSWEEVIKQPHFYVWRKAVNNSSLYEYKVFGSFFDISAYAFYAVQRDLEFRKQWDKLVLKLDIVEMEPTSEASAIASTNELLDFQDSNQCTQTVSSQVVDDTGNELVHWVMKYPYPMKSREYLFLRRSRVDYARATIATVSRSVPYPEIPETEEHVRVHDYISQMVIRPHSTSAEATGEDFHTLGFDYLLTYFDDTRAAFPSAAYNWMASRGVPDFVEKMHRAALDLTESGSLSLPPLPPTPSVEEPSTASAQLSQPKKSDDSAFSLLYLKNSSSSSPSSSFSDSRQS